MTFRLRKYLEYLSGQSYDRYVKRFGKHYYSYRDLNGNLMYSDDERDFGHLINSYTDMMEKETDGERI